MTPHTAEPVNTPSHLSDLLWSQWRSLGVPAAAPTSQLLIDPEALLFATASHLRKHPDDRIYDGAISWAIKYHSLITTALIKRMYADADADDQAAFEQLAGRVAQHTDRLTWPSNMNASTWEPATDPTLPDLAGAPALSRLRMRALFGANARAEVVTFLACISDQHGSDLASISRAIGFSKRHVATPLDHLALAGFVEKWMPANSHRYRLADAARPFLLASRQPSAALEWINWPRRYQLLRLIAAAQNQLNTQGGLVAATAMLKRSDKEFAGEGISALGTLPSAGWTTEQADRIRSWINHAAGQLTTGRPYT